MFRHKKWVLLLSAACFSLFMISVWMAWGGRSGLKPPSSAGNRPDMPEPDPHQSEVTLKVSVSMHAGEYAELKRVAADNEAVRPGLRIELENIPAAEAYAKLKKAAQLGDAPDVMLLRNEWVIEFAALGFLLPVDAMFTSEMQALQLEPALSQVKWNGYLWGYPKDVDLYVMAYSTKRLREAKMDRPPATAEQLAELVDATHDPEKGYYGVYVDLSDPSAFVALVRMMGGKNTQSKALPVRLTEPNAMKAVESVLFPNGEGGEKYSLAKSFPEIGPNWDPWKLLAEGKIAGMLTAFSDYRQHAKEGVIWTALPLPKGETIWKSNWLNGRSFAIYSRTEKAEPSFALIRELASSPALRRYWEANGPLPSMRYTYEVGGLRTDESVEPLLTWLNHDEAAPIHPQKNRQLTVLKNELEQLRKGAHTYKSFAEQTELQWNGRKPTESGGGQTPQP